MLGRAGPGAVRSGPLAEGDKMAAGRAWPVPPWAWSCCAGQTQRLFFQKIKIDWESTSDLISLLEKNLK